MRALVANRINRAYLAHQVITQAFGELEYPVYEIGQSTAIHDAVAAGQTIFEHDPGYRWISEYQRLAKEVAGGS